ELMYRRCSKMGKRWRQRSASVVTSTAKVRLPQIFVLQELLRLAAEHEAPGREDVATVCDRERHVRILLDDEHRDAGLVHLLDDLQAPLHTHRRDAPPGVL